MKSYAMVFSPVDAAGTDSSARAWNYELSGGDDTALPAGSPEVWEAGWVGSTGPGIEQDQWPRSTFTGLPMQHIFTVRLPGEYLPDAQKYPDVVAFSFFAGDGQFAEDEATEGVANAASDDPFEVQYAQARVHPYQLLLRDILDAEFAVLYLSEEEFSSRTPPPQDVRRPVSIVVRRRASAPGLWRIVSSRWTVSLLLWGGFRRMIRMPVRSPVMCLRMLTRRLVI